MNTPSAPAGTVHNGSALAAILAAGLGCFALAVLAIAADHLAYLRRLLSFYGPTGALSGVTTVAADLWLAAWLIFHRLWRQRDLPAALICSLSFILLACAFLFTFPPLADLF